MTNITSASFRGAVHATDEEDAASLVGGVSAHYVDGYRPFVTLDIGPVDFFVHVDAVADLRAAINAALDSIELPTVEDDLRTAWRRDTSTDLSLADWVEALAEVLA